MGDVSTYTGRRVEWRGPTQNDHVSIEYQQAIASGERRPPTSVERRQLTAGDLGTVGALASVQAIGHFYVITFDHGVEIETVLPGAGQVVRFVDDVGLEPGVGRQVTSAAATGPRRYANHRVPVTQRLRAFISRQAST